MELPSQIQRVISSMKDVLLIIWDSEQGFQAVSNYLDLPLDESAVEGGFSAFTSIVMDEDRETFSVFVKKIAAGTAGKVKDAEDNSVESFVPICENRVNVSVRMKKRSGVYFYHNMECFLAKDEAGAVAGMVIRVEEMSAEEIYRLQLAKNITNDRTPALFLMTAGEVIQANPGRRYALIQFDVAKFKVINDLYGEDFGDELLSFFIESLQVICTAEQLFVRLTADVFMILTPYEDKQDILDFIRVIRDNLLGYKEIKYRLVFGVSYVQDVNGKLRKFGDQAALARQSIKGNAIEDVAFFEEDMKNTVLSRKYLEDNMEKALVNREYMMYLQPKYSIGGGGIVGAEALVRWIRPNGGILPPGKFIPIFEENGFVVKLDIYIWEEACRAVRSWMDRGWKPVPVSVNMSRIHLKKQDYIKVLNGLIDKYQIPKRYLEIEITETTETAQTAAGVKLLKENGFTLLMDDFGSGYSSLNMLKDTEFDVIKIDRGFLQDCMNSERGQKIVENTIRMTRSIGLGMVAEGVETKDQADFLYESGCDVAQGFYYAKPMALEEFEKLLEK